MAGSRVLFCSFKNLCRDLEEDSRSTSCRQGPLSFSLMEKQLCP